jgi:flagellar protein FlaJ
MSAYVIPIESEGTGSSKYLRKLPLFFGVKYFKKVVNASFGKDYALMENLRKAHVNATSVEYRAWVLEMTIIFTFVAVAGAVVGFLLLHTFFALAVFVAPLLFYYMSGSILTSWQNSIKKKFTGMNFIRFLNLFNIFISSGTNLVDVFDRIGHSGFGAIGDECNRIVTDVRSFAMDITTAMQESAEYSPSRQWSEFMGGIVASMRSGSNVVDYVNGETLRASLEWEKEVQKNTESLNIFSEIYATVGNAFPLFLIFLVGIMSALGAMGTIGPTITLFLALVIPTTLSGVFVWLFASSIKEGFQ